MTKANDILINAKNRVGDIFLGGAVSLSLSLRSTLAHAGGSVGEMAKNVNTDISGNIPALMSTVAYIVGVGFVIGGLMKMKKHLDAPQQVGLKEALGGVAIGGAVVAVTFIVNAIVSSLGASGAAGTIARPQL